VTCRREGSALVQIYTEQLHRCGAGAKVRSRRINRAGQKQWCGAGAKRYGAGANGAEQVRMVRCGANGAERVRINWVVQYTGHNGDGGEIYRGFLGSSNADLLNPLIDNPSLRAPLSDERLSCSVPFFAPKSGSTSVVGSRGDIPVQAAPACDHTQRNFGQRMQA